MKIFIVVLFMVLDVIFFVINDCKVRAFSRHSGSEPILEQTISTSDLQAEPVRDVAAPVFLKKMDAVVINAGEEARFDVRVSGVPEPKVVWYRGSNEVKDEGRFVHIDAIEEDLFTLVIESSESGDAGQYKCVASNEAGQTSCEAQLIVREKEVDKKPLNENVQGTKTNTVEDLKFGRTYYTKLHPVRRITHLTLFGVDSDSVLLWD